MAEKTEGPKVGDFVVWWNQGVVSNDPCPAIVTQVGAPGILSLTAFTPDGSLVAQGVRHKDDEGLRANHRRRSGCWAEKD